MTVDPNPRPAQEGPEALDESNRYMIDRYNQRVELDAEGKPVQQDKDNEGDGDQASETTKVTARRTRKSPESE